MHSCNSKYKSECDTLTIMINTYQNIIEELKSINEFLTNYIKDTRDIKQLFTDESTIITYNSKINNTILSLKSIYENTKIPYDYGQGITPFKNLNSAKEVIKINHSLKNNMNNLSSLKLIPICNLSAFEIGQIQKKNRTYHYISANKLNRITTDVVLTVKIPIITKNDLIPDLLHECNESKKNIEDLIYLFDINIKRAKLGYQHIVRISKIPHFY